MAQITKSDQLLAIDAGKFFNDPLGWAAYSFDWDNDPSIQIVKTPEKYKHLWKSEYGLDEWALELLIEWGKAIKANGFNGKKAVKAFQAAITSGHGIGKSTLTAIIILFIMSTRPNCRGMVTANTSDQLRTKTWAELGKWKKRCVFGHWFEYNNGKGNMNLYHKDYPEAWRTDATTCREENSESFAGLHAANSSPFYIFDESSAIPDKIFEVAEGGMTDGEPFWFLFGNPTRNSGRFREAFRRFRHRWYNKSVDSRLVQITNKEKIEEWIADYGIDSDFVKVRVKGVFPSQSIKQFFPESITDPARGKQLKPYQYDFAPKILTLDPAWEGDDALEFGLLQGLTFQLLKTVPKNDNDVEIATLLAQFEDLHKADGVNIDAGYGTGIASVGRTWGRDWNLVWFGGKSPDEGYLNNRAYMAGRGKQWLIDGGCLPDDDELYSDLQNTETVPNLSGKIQLESKKDMKKRGLRSPNKMDCWMLGFRITNLKEDC
jgi:hypothetical protein